MLKGGKFSTIVDKLATVIPHWCQWQHEHEWAFVKCVEGSRSWWNVLIMQMYNIHKNIHFCHFFCHLKLCDSIHCRLCFNICYGFTEFYRFVRAKHKEKFNETCIQLTGQPAELKVDNSSKKRSSTEMLRQDAKKPRTENEVTSVSVMLLSNPKRWTK